MARLEQDTLFVALTRPQLLFGVPYVFFVLNIIIATEAFLIFKSFLALGIALIAHAIAWAATYANPHLIDTWLTAVRKCPRVPNYSVWQCNSYRA